MMSASPAHTRRLLTGFGFAAAFVGLAMAPTDGAPDAGKLPGHSVDAVEWVAMQAIPADEPLRIIVFIADGTGTSLWTAAHLTADSLAVEQFPVAGLIDTRADPQIITDSAASATAYASGIRTYNGAIGVDGQRRPVETVLERAEQRGMATGLVATSSITHATPAAFAAHVENRDQHREIAAQMSRQGIEVLLGGGRKFFAQAMGDNGRSVLDEIRLSCTFVENGEQFRNLDLGDTDRLVGLFAENDMPEFARRDPTLPAMTAAALEILGRDPEGFFLMVEGSQPDWRAHDQEPIEKVVAEVLDFDRAVGLGLAYQRKHPDTLILVLADHETGGMAIHTRRGKPVARYTTDGHTASMVPLFARGPGAEQFGGIIANDEIGRLLLDRVGR
jgi:alkaline phosphatase